MFRTLTKTNQQLSHEECAAILKQELRGVLAVNGDDGYPYALPINFYYDETNHKIYFHGGMTGHKADAIARSDKASFCVYDRGYRKEGHWSLNIRSVIAFGRIHAVTDWTEEIMVEFCRRFTQDTDFIFSEIETYKNRTAVFCLDIEHMTGKLVNES